MTKKKGSTQKKLAEKRQREHERRRTESTLEGIRWLMTFPSWLRGPLP